MTFKPIPMSNLRTAIFPFFFLLCLLVSCNEPERREKADSFIDPVDQAYKENASRDRLFDSDWKFYKGKVSGGHKTDLDDSGWRKLTLPHDWSIEDLPGQKTDEVVGPFIRKSVGGPSTGHVVGGTAWYRKTFQMDVEDKDKLVGIRFDGVYMNSDIWINGHHLGNYPNGYNPFAYNLTPYLKPVDQDNVLAVEVKNEGENSRWYTGSGIYRHVWLSVTDKVHLDKNETHITTIKTSNTHALMKMSIGLVNSGQEDAHVSLSGIAVHPDGSQVDLPLREIEIMAGSTFDATSQIEVPQPKLWSPESPELYLLRLTLKKEGRTVDALAIPFGIRTLSFSAENGFLLNGEPYLMKGGCVHHDNGPMGSATFDRAEYRKIELLKSNGFNAVRTSHNPPSAQFLDACDKLGMLVIDEAFDAWEIPKKPQDYSQYFEDWWKTDIQNLVKRDRNHPSIVMWSIGNEIPERGDSTGLVWTKQLSNAVKEIDTTIPVNEAICAFWKTPDRPWSDTQYAYELLDVGGYNYQWEQYESDHLDFPQRVIVGTESFAREALQNWRTVQKYPYVVGDFVWTAMDYFGESGIGSAMIGQAPKPPLAWPWFNGYCGDLDICGIKKPQSYFRDVVWGNSTIEMAVHSPIPNGEEEFMSLWGWPDEQRSWNWSVDEGRLMQVNVYSTADEVALKLNDELVEVKSVSDSTNLTAAFEVPYRQGQLKALAISDGQVVDSIILQTAGKPHQIQLTPERLEITNDFNDLSFVRVEVLDKSGLLVPDASMPIDFDIVGAGELVAVANGNPTDLKSFQRPSVSTFKGRCMIVLRSNGHQGDISLTASSSQLISSSTTIKVVYK